jgi:DNA-binding NtrC family response regulator
MEKKIIFVAEDQNLADNLCQVLHIYHYNAQHLQSFQMFEGLPENEPLTAVLIDLDSVAISNIDIRNFKRENPNVPLLAISYKPFHPDLQESMRSHIFACVSKPVDPDELIFLLNSALENGASPINPL